MSIKNDLIVDIVEKLEEYNEFQANYGEDTFDYIEHLAVLEQQLGDKKYEAFLNDLQYGDDYYIINVEDDKGSFYQLPKVIIFFPTHSNYFYEIGFGYNRHSWGYCQCVPTDEGYNEERQCCGIDCDWEAPLFTVSKSSIIGQSTFNGLERDLWAYTDACLSEIKDKEQREMEAKMSQLLEMKEKIVKEIEELKSMKK